MIELERECDTFCKAMIGRPPPDIVRASYVRAHEAGPILSGAPEKATRFDHWLVRFARGSPTRTRFADSYAVLFARTTTLRRKLVLLLAILESTAPASRWIDTPDPGSPGGFFVLAFSHSCLFVVRAAIATFFMTAVRISFALTGFEE
ncbi:MAG TPA: hypothetical protein VFR10_08015 [bacterium]|nr:hypothetical protein [bacterium]